jgi:hypothetical protein
MSSSESDEPVGGGLFDATPTVRSAESRGETVDQVLDRNVAELLQELRVAFTGVQILFAFLLSLAFTQRFTELGGFGIAVYTVALLSTALATMLLIAPVSFHRIVFRHSQKDDLVRNAHRMALGGLACLVVSVVGAVLLILEVVLGQPEAAWYSVAVGVFFVLLWLMIPMVSRARGKQPGTD